MARAKLVHDSKLHGLFPVDERPAEVHLLPTGKQKPHLDARAQLL
jgi:hypothetical protein